MSRRVLLTIWLMGVILPLVTIGVELAFGWSAEDLFDPLPTWGHLLAALCVPLGNGLLLRADGRAAFGPVFLAGAALGIAVVYALYYLPLVPLGIVAIVFFGLGLLPLTPALATVAGLLAAREVRRASSSSTGGPARRTFWLGLAVGLALLVALDAPKTFARLAIRRAASPDPAESRRGLRWLRTVGGEPHLLRACYRPEGLGPDLLGQMVLSMDDRSLTTQRAQAREIYYRVTGSPFNSVPPPVFKAPRGGAPWSRWNPDPEQGAEMVGARLPNLSLASSRLDGSVDPDAALAYLEWTLEFRNDAARAQEARGQIQLPAGASVSRLTLWIGGEEREAAFGGRDQTRRAYEAVVQQRRDPVLVTTAGPDRVQIQCFPVPPSGGLMKVRLGMTLPFDLDAPERGVLTLPFFVERNFQLDRWLGHAVWVESEAALHASGPGMAIEGAGSGRVAARGVVGDGDLPRVRVGASRDAAVRETWALDRRAKNAVVRQVLRPRPVVSPSAIVLVVDGSRGMAAHAEAVRRALTALPAGVEVSAVVAGDEIVEVPASKDVSALAAALERVSWQGGADNIPALLRAWDLAARREGAVIVWVHGPQPVLLQRPDTLRQRWERRPDGPRLVAVAVDPATPNRILEALDGLPGVSLWPWRGGAGAGLSELFARWRPGATRLAAERIHEPPQARHAPGTRSSDHLVRLWARDRIETLLASGAAPPRVEATDLAVRYQLVSPVSGAVVLETAGQYEAAGLQPADRAEVPAIPEPETWALLIVAALVTLVALISDARRRKAPALA